MTSREPVENKGSKRSMHWNVARNGLPVFVRLVRVLDRWRND